jgi:hypothetical protein
MNNLLSKVSVPHLERILEIKRREGSLAPLLRRRGEKAPGRVKVPGWGLVTLRAERP